MSHPDPIRTDDESALVAALKAGDEAAFQTVVDRYHPSMVRIAGLYVNDSAVAEEVAQETWIGALKGLARFEGRSSFKTWLFTILTNRAKTRAGRESRYVPLDPMWDSDTSTDEFATVTAERFDAQGYWNDSLMPRAWETVPEDYLSSREMRAVLERALAELPPNQAKVIRLRDVEGWSSDEVCNVLDISESNQRVLLHRARSRVRAALEGYLSHH